MYSVTGVRGGGVMFSRFVFLLASCLLFSPTMVFCGQYGDSGYGFADGDGAEEQVESVRRRAKRFFKGRASRLSRLRGAASRSIKRLGKATAKRLNPCSSTGTPLPRLTRCLVAKGALRHRASTQTIKTRMMDVARKNPVWAGRMCEAVCATGLRSRPLDTKNGQDHVHRSYAQAKAEFMASIGGFYGTQSEEMVEAFNNGLGEISDQEDAKKTALCSGADGEPDDAITEMVLGALSADGLLDQHAINFFENAALRAQNPGSVGPGAPINARGQEETQGAKVLLATDMGEIARAFCTHVCMNFTGLQSEDFSVMSKFGRAEILPECQDPGTIVALEHDWWSPDVKPTGPTGSRPVFGGTPGGFFGGAPGGAPGGFFGGGAPGGAPGGFFGGAPGGRFFGSAPAA